MLPSKANAGWAAAETCGTGRGTCWALLPPAAERRGWGGGLSRLAWLRGALAPVSCRPGSPALSDPATFPQSERRPLPTSGERPRIVAAGGVSRPAGAQVCPGVPRCAPPLVGHGVLPSSLRPGLSWFQFGDRFFCKVSRTYGRGRDISRVISHFTAKS